MKMEGKAELKELDRIVQEYAAIKRERDELLEDKECLERELQKIENVESHIDQVVKENDKLRAIIRKIAPVQEEKCK